MNDKKPVAPVEKEEQDKGITPNKEPQDKSATETATYLTRDELTAILEKRDSILQSRFFSSSKPEEPKKEKKETEEEYYARNEW